MFRSGHADGLQNWPAISSEFGGLLFCLRLQAVSLRPLSRGCPRGDVMSRYRAYVLDEHYHIVGLHDFDADTETAALDYAWRYAFGHEVEVWQGFRRVGLLRHRKSAALVGGAAGTNTNESA